MNNDTVPITVFWRPGCVWCARLRSGLLAAGVHTREINIWQDEKAAEAVRMVANGNETVPTVTVGTTILVNPSVKTVLAEMSRQTPVSSSAAHVVDSVVTKKHDAFDVTRWLLVALFVVLSFLAEGLGQVALSWALDAVNVAVFFFMRAVRNSRSAPTLQ